MRLKRRTTNTLRPKTQNSVKHKPTRWKNPITPKPSAKTQENPWTANNPKGSLVIEKKTTLSFGHCPFGGKGEGGGVPFPDGRGGVEFLPGWFGVYIKWCATKIKWEFAVYRKWYNRAPKNRVTVWRLATKAQPQIGAFLKILSSHILFYYNFLWCDDGIYDYDEEGDGVGFIVNMG